LTSASARSQRFQLCQCARRYFAIGEAPPRRYPPPPPPGGGAEGENQWYRHDSVRTCLVVRSHLFKLPQSLQSSHRVPCNFFSPLPYLNVLYTTINVQYVRYSCLPIHPSPHVAAFSGRPTPPPDTISLIIYFLFGLPAFQGLWTNTANLHLSSLLFQTIPFRRRRIITHTVLVPNKPFFICPPPHQPISPHVLLYMCILIIYSYIYYKNLHPSQKYCDILSGTESQDWKQESEHPPFLIM
jgi:hypothetical protein